MKYNYVVIYTHPILEKIFGGFNNYNNCQLVKIPENQSPGAIRDLKIDYKKVDTDLPFCFITVANIYDWYGSYLTESLRRKYPSCQLVCYFADISNRFSFEIESVFNHFDYVCSFDKKESERYGFNYIPVMYVDDFCNNENSLYDVVFVGNVKKRYDRIIRIYELLLDYGYNCCFHVTGIPDYAWNYHNGLLNNEISFEENINLIKSSNCILDITQHDGYSPNIRFPQALYYNKKLLTDCPELYENDYYPDDLLGNVYYISDISDYKCIKEMNKKIPKKMIDKYFSNMHFIESIESRL